MNLRWTIAIFLVALVLVGVPFWLTPYQQLTLPDAWFMPGMVVVLPIAVGLVALELASVLKTAVILTGAMLTANMLRILFDTWGDPTSHNLWPLELILTLFAGIGFSLLGCLGGWIVRQVLSMVRPK